MYKQRLTWNKNKGLMQVLYIASKTNYLGLASKTKISLRWTSYFTKTTKKAKEKSYTISIYANHI